VVLCEESAPQGLFDVFEGGFGVGVVLGGAVRPGTARLCVGGRGGGVEGLGPGQVAGGMGVADRGRGAGGAGVPSGVAGWAQAVGRARGKARSPARVPGAWASLTTSRGSGAAGRSTASMSGLRWAGLPLTRL